MRLETMFCALVIVTSPCAASEAQVTWPTFFRAGPSAHYTVLDELLRGTRLEVQSCAETWCLVQYDRTSGYVERNALNTADFPPSPAQPESGCFASRRAGYGAGEMFRYCKR